MANVVKLKQCENCGADYDIMEPACPYCGTFNAVGGEKQYMEHMEDIREDVENLSDTAGSAYTEEIKKTGNIVIKTIIAAAVFGMLLFGFFKLCDYLTFGNYSKADVKKQLMWEQENFPILNAWYDAGEYEKILEFRYHMYDDKENEKISLYDWEHFEFMEMYAWRDYCFNELELAKQATKKKDIKRHVSWALQDTVHMMFDLRMDSLTEKEKEQVTGWQKEVEETVLPALNVNFEEAKQIYENSLEEKAYSDKSAGTYMVFNWSMCEKAVEPYVKRFMETQ